MMWRRCRKFDVWICLWVFTVGCRFAAADVYCVISGAAISVFRIGFFLSTKSYVE